MENSTNVSFVGNVEPCPTPGCELLSLVMNGTFSFKGNEVIVHQAPEWSVRALSSVQQAIADAVRIAADPNAPIGDAKKSFEKAAFLTRINSRDSPPGLRSQILELLSLQPLLKVKGLKRKILVAGVILHFLLNHYSTYKDNAIEITHDLQPAAEWIVDHVEQLGSSFESEIEKALCDLKKP
ncbi:hypothetical protein [Glutamicibacter nicotianae]|uniref:hypothetical protein n=1 Tax=Glutamicibacter nicotianae TaxID=37929 RepID=UPI0030795DB7